MAANDIKALKELASGGFREITLTPADISAASASHTHAAADITDLNAAAAGALYDGALSIAGAVVSDANLRLINGDDHEAILGYENITSNRFINLPNASGTLALTSDFAAPPAIGSTAPAAGTFTTLTANNGIPLTASAPVLDLAQTWNNAAVPFTALRVNATNTFSAGESYLANFQTGGVPQVVIRKDGRLTAVQLQATGLIFSGGDVQAATGFAFYWSNSDLFLRRDAAGVLAQYNGNNAQESRIYGQYSSATNFQRLTIKTKAVTLSGLTGASVATTTGLIPDGAVLVGLTTRVSTAITGATGYDIGDGTDADRWGANVAIALNTSSDNRDWTAGTIQCFTAAQEVTLTAVGSNFTGGAVVIVAHYLAGEAD